MAGTNGRMMVDTTKSPDSQDDNENDDDNASLYSNYSSVVDMDGHLCPAVEADVFLEMDDSLDDDGDAVDESDGGNDNNEESPDVSTSSTAAPTARLERQKDTANLPSPKSSKWPEHVGRRIHPGAAIPTITVMEWGSESKQGGGPEATDVHPHIEPLVIVENENAKNKPARGHHISSKTQQKFRSGAKSAAPSQKDGTSKIVQRMSKSNKGESTDRATKRRSELEPNRHTVETHEQESEGVSRSRAKRPKSGHSNNKQQAETVPNDPGDEQQEYPSKNKFTSVLERFQKMSENG